MKNTIPTKKELREICFNLAMQLSEDNQNLAFKRIIFELNLIREKKR